MAETAEPDHRRRAARGTTGRAAAVVVARVFRLPTERSRRRGKLVAAVWRATPTAKGYRFPLTERRLRKLKPGAYRVEVRIGTTRDELGPPTARVVTVKEPAPRARRILRRGA